MADEPDPERLKRLQSRIDAAQKSQEPTPRRDKSFDAAHLAWRMVIELVVGLIIGFGIGYGLDSLLGTLPIFLILFTLLGFAAGVRTMMRSAGEIQRKRERELRESAAEE